jgi:pimeloyl-ACP methyl ester carboxylesterase
MMPVLVLHGDDDRLVPLAVGRALAERAARGRLLVAEGGSHMLPVNRADWLADAIVAFEEDPP